MMPNLSKPLLPQPVGRQSEVLYLPAGGHQVVLGTAGSGKTTLAMLRSKYLASRRLAHYGKTLLLSFNNTLLRYFESFADLVGEDVEVRTYHRFARGYLHSRGKMPHGAICGTSERQQLIEDATIYRLAAEPGEPALKRPVAFLVEEMKWLAHHGIGSVPEYEEAERSGRHGTRLPRRERAALYRLYEGYRQLRAQRGWLYDWDDIALTVCDEMALDDGPRLYRHIVIDEGQDFSPMMLRSLATAVPTNGSLTFFGDAAQQIYGNKVSWRDAGLSVQKPWHFEENYRNTPEIARLAVAVSAMPYFQGTPDLVVPRMIRAAGVPPALVSFRDLEAELAFVTAFAIARSKTESVAVLARDRHEEGDVARRLGGQAIRLHKKMSAWVHGPGIYYGTYAAAKGLEFDTVVLSRLSSELMPRQEDVVGFGPLEAAAVNGKLFYVGITRAKSTLVLTYTGSPTSLLPTAGGLYTTERR
jgi:superfamily I DNA/RNA helicase